MTALAGMFSFRGRLGWLLIGLVLASSVAQASLLQAAGTAPGEGVANLVYLLGSGASLLLHELVRTVMARPRTARAEAAAAAAGPLVSLAAGLLIIGFTRVAFIAGLADPMVRALAAVATLNIVLAGANLLPALPLDGGHLLHGAVLGFGRDQARAARVARIATEAAGTFMIAAGVAAALLAAVADAFPWVSVGVLLLATGRRDTENVARH
jgi:Zn-dependent protease